MVSLRVKNVAVIGAGPSGVAAAKYLLAEKAFDRITLFEQRARPGGIWNYTPNLQSEDLFTIPQTDPRGKNQEPVWTEPETVHEPNGISGLHKTPSFLSPVYESLETNIPRSLMGFSDLDWPEDTQLFPKHETVLEYIEKYGEDVRHLVQYGTQVTDIRAADSRIDGAWHVTTRNLSTSETATTTFDAIIVANGHFITPYIPPIPGLEEWAAAYPGTISHSKYYRRATDFANKKVIVLGNSASGSDISAQISTVCAAPLLWSSRSANFLSSSSPATPTRQPVAQITSLDPTTRTAHFVDGTSTASIDALVFATGYFYSLPFLSSVSPPLIRDGAHVHHLFKHTFFHPRPTLALLALPQRVIPFPIAEAQAAAVSRVFSGRLSLPSQADMQAAEHAILASATDPRNVHLLPFPRDGEFINELSRWCDKAKASSEGGEAGKRPPRWGEWEFWCRERFPEIRRAFVGLGGSRKGVKRVEDMGFVFEGKEKGEEKEG